VPLRRSRLKAALKASVPTTMARIDRGASSSTSDPTDDQTVPPINASRRPWMAIASGLALAIDSSQ
jgi:hypothetical protein